MTENILKIPYSAVNNNWDFLHKYLNKIGNPRYIIIGDVDLDDRQDISNLGNLVGVVGHLGLRRSSIESLGELKEVNGYMDLGYCENIKTLGKLKRVEGHLWLSDSSIESLGELEFVGKDLLLYDVDIPPSELDKVEIIGDIRR
jgi:hypothetical protein